MPTKVGKCILTLLLTWFAFRVRSANALSVTMAELAEKLPMKKEKVEEKSQGEIEESKTPTRIPTLYAK